MIKLCIYTSKYGNNGTDSHVHKGADRSDFLQLESHMAALTVERGACGSEAAAPGPVLPTAAPASQRCPGPGSPWGCWSGVCLGLVPVRSPSLSYLLSRSLKKAPVTVLSNARFFRPAFLHC